MMPIKSENRALYPKDWSNISRQAKVRTHWHCQHVGCTARQYAAGEWRAGVWVELAPPAMSYGQGRQNAADVQFTLYGDDPDGTEKVIVIVLTTAHLDHDPTNCAPANLAAMCQRHHLAYDHKHHLGNANATRMAKRGNMELPLGVLGTERDRDAASAEGTS